MNGSVRPVNGSRVVTTAMLMIAWKTSQAVRPVASSAANGSGARPAILKPR